MAELRETVPSSTRSGTEASHPGLAADKLASRPANIHRSGRDRSRGDADPRARLRDAGSAACSNDAHERVTESPAEPWPATEAHNSLGNEGRAAPHISFGRTRRAIEGAVEMLICH